MLSFLLPSIGIFTETYQEFCQAINCLSCCQKAQPESVGVIGSLRLSSDLFPHSPSQCCLSCFLYRYFHKYLEISKCLLDTFPVSSLYEHYQSFSHNCIQHFTAQCKHNFFTSGKLYRTLHFSVFRYSYNLFQLSGNITRPEVINMIFTRFSSISSGVHLIFFC